MYQSVDAAKASDRVAEKAKALDAKLAQVNAQTEAERKLFPPAPAPKASKAEK